jgi:hypothetical protein
MLEPIGTRDRLPRGPGWSSWQIVKHISEDTSQLRGVRHNQRHQQQPCPKNLPHTRSVKQSQTLGNNRRLKENKNKGQGDCNNKSETHFKVSIESPCPPSANRRASPEQSTPQLHQVLVVVQRLNSAHHPLEVCPDCVDPLDAPTCQGHQRRVAMDAHGGGLRNVLGPAEGCKRALIQVIPGRPTVREERGKELTTFGR